MANKFVQRTATYLPSSRTLHPVPQYAVETAPGLRQVHLLWTQAPGRTHVTCDWMFAPQSFVQADFDPGPGDAVDFWDMTNRQDWAICEQSQLGVSSRRYTPGPYSARESLPAAWDREYLRRFNAWQVLSGVLCRQPVRCAFCAFSVRIKLLPSPKPDEPDPPGGGTISGVPNKTQNSI